LNAGDDVTRAAAEAIGELSSVPLVAIDLAAAFSARSSASAACTSQNCHAALRSTGKARGYAAAQRHPRELHHARATSVVSISSRTCTICAIRPIAESVSAISDTIIGNAPIANAMPLDRMLARGVVFDEKAFGRTSHCGWIGISALCRMRACAGALHRRRELAARRETITRTPVQHARRINATNVRGLKLAFTFATGVARGHERRRSSQTVSCTSSRRGPTRCSRSTREAGRRVKWKFDAGAGRLGAGTACCDAVNRGAAYANGPRLFNALDGSVFALEQ
jgi:hypothetical protein